MCQGPKCHVHGTSALSRARGPTTTICPASRTVESLWMATECERHQILGIVARRGTDTGRAPFTKVARSGMP